MQTPLDSGDHDLLQSLERLGAATIPELCEAMRVTATAIRQRLSRLATVGFIEREPVKHGRGRPHHAYRLTIRGVRELGDDYQFLAGALWGAVSRMSPEIREAILEDLELTLINRYGSGVSGESVAEKLSTLGVSLQQGGFQAEVCGENPLPVLREHHCPYPELAREDGGICELERRVFSRLTGTELHITRSFRNGDSCCEFECNPSNLSTPGVCGVREVEVNFNGDVVSTSK